MQTLGNFFVITLWNANGFLYLNGLMVGQLTASGSGRSEGLRSWSMEGGGGKKLSTGWLPAEIKIDYIATHTTQKKARQSTNIINSNTSVASLKITQSPGALPESRLPRLDVHDVGLELPVQLVHLVALAPELLDHLILIAGSMKGSLL